MTERVNWPKGLPDQKSSLTKRVTWPKGFTDQKGLLTKRVYWPKGLTDQKGKLTKRVYWPKGLTDQKGCLTKRVAWPKGLTDQKAVRPEGYLKDVRWVFCTLCRLQTHHISLWSERDHSLWAMREPSNDKASCGLFQTLQRACVMGGHHIDCRFLLLTQHVGAVQQTHKTWEVDTWTAHFLWTLNAWDPYSKHCKHGKWTHGLHIFFAHWMHGNRIANTRNMGSRHMDCTFSLDIECMGTAQQTHGIWEVETWTANFLWKLNAWEPYSKHTKHGT